MPVCHQQYPLTIFYPLATINRVILYDAENLRNIVEHP